MHKVQMLIEFDLEDVNHSLEIDYVPAWAGIEAFVNSELYDRGRTEKVRILATRRVPLNSVLTSVDLTSAVVEFKSLPIVWGGG